MYTIYYYQDSSGNIPVMEYIQSLSRLRSKDGRIKYCKVRDYIKVLEENGIAAGEPYVKHINGEIWELRPLRDRIMFATWDEEKQGYILLHQFMKQTQKTPQREINTAKRRLQELQEDKGNE